MSTTNLVLGLDTLSAREQLIAFKANALQALRGIGVEIDDAPITKLKTDLAGLKDFKVNVEVIDNGGVAALKKGIHEIFDKRHNLKIDSDESLNALSRSLETLVTRTRVVQLTAAFSLDDGVLQALPAANAISAAIQQGITSALGGSYKLASTQELESQVLQAVRRALDLGFGSNHELGIDDDKLKTRIANAANSAPIKLDQTIAKALREGLKSPIQLELDVPHILEQIQKALSAAKFKIDADVKTGKPAGVAGTGINYGELKNILQGILVPVADEMARVGDTIAAAAKKVSTQPQLPAGVSEGRGPMRASESLSVVDKSTGRRRTVTTRLEDPEGVLGGLEQTREMEAITAFQKAMLDQRMAEIGKAEAEALADLKRHNESVASFQKAMLDQRLEEIGRNEAEALAAKKKHDTDVQAFSKAMLDQRLAEIERAEREADAAKKKHDTDVQAFSKAMMDQRLAEIEKAEREADAAKKKHDADVQSFTKAMLDQRLAEIEKAERESAAQLRKHQEDVQAFSKAMLDQRLAEIERAEREADAAKKKHDTDVQAFSKAMLDQRLAEIERSEREAASELKRHHDSVEAFRKAMMDQRLAEIERSEREEMQEKARQEDRVRAFQQAMTEQRLSEISKAEREATQRQVDEIRRFYSQARYDASKKYDSQGADIAAASAVSQRYGRGAAEELLGANAHLLNRMAELNEHLREAAPRARGVRGALSELNRAANDAHSGVRGLAGSLGMLWTTWGSTVPIVAMAALGAAVRSTLATGKDLEFQLQFVSSLSDGATVSTTQFRQSLKGMSTDATEAAGAMRALAQNGLGVQSALTALPTILRLATVGEMSLSDAALGATGVMEAFGLSVADLPRIADVFSKAAAISNTSVQEMVESMKQASTVSDQYHVSLESTAAALATMAKRNITGSAAGTAFRNMWVELATPTKKAGEAMKAVGLEIFDAQKKMLDADVIMRRVRDSVAGLNEQSKLTTLNAIFGERGAKAINAILADFDEFERRRDELVNNSKDFTRQVSEELNQTLQGKYKSMISEYQGATLEVFETTTASLKGLIDEVRLLIADPSFADSLKTLVGGFVDLTRYVMDNGRAILMLIGTWQGLRLVLGAVNFATAISPQVAGLAVALRGAGTAATVAGAQAAAAGAQTAAGMTAAAAATAGAATATTGLRAAMAASLPVIRSVMGALTGGVGLVIALGVEYLLLRDQTDEATRAQKDFTNSLELSRQAQEAEIERLGRRNELLRRAVQLMDGAGGKKMSFGQAMETAEAEQGQKAVADLEKQYADKAAIYNKAVRDRADAQRLLDKMGPAAGGLPTYRKQVQRLEEANAVITSMQGEVTSLWRSLDGARRNQVARTANEREESLVKQIQQVEDANKRYEEMAKANPKLLKEVQPLPSPRGEPLPAEEHEKRLKAFIETINKYGRTVDLPDRDADRAANQAKALAERIKNERLTLEAAVTQFLKTESERRFQDAREAAADELVALQLQYESDEISYARYLQRKEGLTRKIEGSRVEEAQSLVTVMENRRAEAEANLNKVMADGKATVLERIKADREYVAALTASQDAKAKADRASADGDLAQIKRQQEVIQSVKDKTNALRDDQLSQALGSNSKLFKLNTEEGRMRAEVNMLPRGTDKEIARYKELTAAIDQYVQITEQRVLNESMKQFFDSLGDSMKAAGQGILGLTESFQALAMIRERAEASDKGFEKRIKENDGNEDEIKKLNKERQRSAKLFQDSEMQAYAKVASSSKQFFSQKTAAYKTLDAVEKAFHAQRMMESGIELSKKLSDAGAWVAAKLQMIWTEMSAQLTSDTTKAGSAAAYTATDTALSVTRTGQKAVEAQTAALTLPPPFSFAALAATVAILASLGVAGRRGSGGAQVSNTGTGTVFGDSSATSDSVSKSIEHLADIDLMTARYSAQMASSLRNIEGNIGNVATLLIRSGTISGSAAGVREGFKTDLLGQVAGTAVRAYAGIITAGLSEVFGLGAAVGKLVSGLFGTKTKITGQGVYSGAQSIESILANGLQSDYFTDVQKKQKFLGATTKKSNKSIYSDASAEYEDQTTKIIKGYVDLVSSAAGPLGVSLDTVQARLKGFIVNIGRIDLKGLSGEDAQKRLEAVFSAVGDNIASSALGGFTEFQRVGEGYLQTVVRVATGVETASLAMRRLRIDMVGLNTVTDKLGDVSAELVRQSLQAREGLSGVSEVLEAVDGTASELVETYLTLVNIRTSLAQMGVNASAVGIDLIAGAGGLSQLADAVTAFEEAFFFDSEKIAINTAKVSSEFTKLGLAMPTSAAGFVSLVRGIDTSTQSGRELLGMVLGLSDRFGELLDAMTALEDTRVDLQVQLLEAQGKKTEALALQRARELEQMDPTLRALQQQVWMAQDLAEKMENLTSAGKSLADFIDSLTQQATDTQGVEGARAAYLQNMSLARTDDETALGKVTDLAQAYLEAAKKSASTEAEYLAVLGQVRSEIMGLNATQVYYRSIDGSHAGGLDYVPFDGYVAELHQGERVQTAAQARSQDETAGQIQALRAELKAQNTAIASYSQQVSKILARWDNDGMPEQRTTA